MNATKRKLCPPKPLKRSKLQNDFQNQYRKEIYDLISGTEYLDQILPNYFPEKREAEKETVVTKDRIRLTPNAKRELMFKKPITLTKRQNNYHTSHKLPNHPEVRGNHNENKNEDNASKNIFKKNPSSVNSKNENIAKKHSISNNTPVNRTKSPRKKAVTEKQSEEVKYQKKIEKKTEEIPKIVQKEVEKTPPKKEKTHNIYENQPFALYNKFFDEVKEDDDDEEEEEEGNVVEYLQKKSREVGKCIDESNTNESERDYSVDFFYEEEQPVITSSSKKPIVKDNTKSDKTNQVNQKTDSNSGKPVSSDAIDAVVDFTSESSDDSEFQNQFFIQEPIHSSNRIPLIKGEKFVSSGAIESLSD